MLAHEILLKFSQQLRKMQLDVEVSPPAFRWFIFSYISYLLYTARIDLLHYMRYELTSSELTLTSIFAYRCKAMYMSPLCIGTGGLKKDLGPMSGTLMTTMHSPKFIPI